MDNEWKDEEGDGDGDSVEGHEMLAFRARFRGGVDDT